MDITIRICAPDARLLLALLETTDQYPDVVEQLQAALLDDDMGVRCADDPGYDPDCPACLRGLPHTRRQHAIAVARGRGVSR